MIIYHLANIIICILFFDLTHFRELGQKYRNIFVRFSVQMKTRKFAFEINWALEGFSILLQIQQLVSLTSWPNSRRLAGNGKRIHNTIAQKSFDFIYYRLHFSWSWQKARQPTNKSLTSPFLKNSFKLQSLLCSGRGIWPTF